eukprot:scaffold1406_cov182-Ochromonas_danica.AAC.5
MKLIQSIYIINLKVVEEESQHVSMKSGNGLGYGRKSKLSVYHEFDMPVRWGFLRLKELEVLNVLAFWIMFWTDFRGITPTDL